MPLARYFFYVGGALLALLFIADASLPRLPAAQMADDISYSIRIHAEQKWPERIVYDTSLPTITPPPSASAAQSVASPATIASAKPREREVFAQLSALDANQLQLSDPKKRQPKQQRQRKMTKRHAPAPVLMVARQFGWFAYW